MPKMISLEEMLACQEELLLVEEHAGSAVDDLEGPEVAMMLSLESMPEEAFRQRREEKRAIRHRWS